MPSGYDGSVRIKADLDHTDFDRGLSAMTAKLNTFTGTLKKIGGTMLFGKGPSSLTAQVNKFGGTLKKLGGLVAMAFGTAALVKFGKESINLASDIQEVQNVIDVTFGRGAAQIEEFARTAAEAYGLSELAAKRYTGTMGAMLKSSGITTSQAQEMSVALAGLAGDMASFYNLDTDTAFEKLRAGISGETEPLKQLGVNMSVANLEAYALSKGITKSYNAMSQAEQVMLRYNYLLSVTGDAQGDFARTSGSFANQIRLLQLNFDQLRIAVGNALIPIAQAVLPSVNAIIAGLTKLAQVFAKVTALLFGKSPEVKATSGVAASAGVAADATDKLADATEGAGNAAKETAKDLKGVLAGFDELNILATNAADGVSNAGGGLGDIGADLDIPSYEAELEETDQLGDAFKSLGEIFVETLDEILAGMPAFKQALLDFAASFNEFNQKLYDAFTFPGVKERVEELGRELADALNGLVGAIDWELWGRTIGAGLNLGLQFLTEFLYSFDWISLGNRLADFINGLVDEVDWYDFGRLLWANFKIGLETFAGFILGLDMPELAQAASNIIIGFFDSMKETINNVDWAGIGHQIAEFLNNIDWINTLSGMAGSIAAGINAAIDTLGTLVAELNWAQIGEAIGEAFNTLMHDIDWADVGKTLSDALTGLIDAMTAFWQTADVTAVGDALVEALKNIDWAKLLVSLAEFILTQLVNNFKILLATPGWFYSIGISIIDSILDGVMEEWPGLEKFFSDSWENVKKFAIETWDKIKEAWSAAATWFDETVIQPLSEYFDGLWKDAKQWASDAWSGITEAWNAASTWFDETVIQPISEFFDGLWEDIKTWASDTWTGIVGVWEVASGWFDENVTQPISKFFSDLWNGIKTKANELWNNIVSIWGNAGKWFEDHVTKPIGDAFEAVGNSIKGVLNGVIGGIENLINGVIKGVNWLISQVNKLSFDVPDWVPSWMGGGQHVGFNIQPMSSVSLPRLANGAVIPPNQQFAAVLGDQRSGKNLEAPAGLIRQMVAEGMQAAMAQGGFGRGGDMTVIMEIDGREFGRASYRYGTAEQQRVGVRLAEVRS